MPLETRTSNSMSFLLRSSLCWTHPSCIWPCVGMQIPYLKSSAEELILVNLPMRNFKGTYHSWICWRGSQGTGKKSHRKSWNPEECIPMFGILTRFSSGTCPGLCLLCHVLEEDASWMVMTSSTQNSYISSCPGVASGALACLPTHSCLDDVFAQNKKKVHNGSKLTWFVVYPRQYHLQ